MINDKSLIGEILNWLEFASVEQTDEAFRVQNEEKAAITPEQSAAGVRPRLIGAILVSLDSTTNERVEKAFALQQFLRGQQTSLPLNDKSLIGEILVWLEFVTGEQVDEAMRVQTEEKAAITPEQSAAGMRPRLIGAILSSLGHTTTERVEKAFALQQVLRKQTQTA